MKNRQNNNNNKHNTTYRTKDKHFEAQRNGRTKQRQTENTN